MAEEKKRVVEEISSYEDLGYASKPNLCRNIGNSPVKVSLDEMCVMENGKTSPEEKKVANCRRPRGEQLLIILTVAGVLLGLLLGFTIRLADPSDTTITMIKFPGELMMRMLKMMIIPIIVTSIVTGVASLNIKKSGSLGAHAIIYYLATTTLATILGIILVYVIHPGKATQGMKDNAAQNREVSTLDTFLDLLRNVFPDNIVAACFEVMNFYAAVLSLFAWQTWTSLYSARTDTVTEIVVDDSSADDGLLNVTSNSSAYNVSNMVKVSKKLNRIHNPNVLGLIAFFVAFGIVLSSLGEEGKPLTKIFHILNNIFLKMIMVVIWYSPLGICCLTAANVLEMDKLDEIGESLGMYIVTVIVGLAIHGFIVLPLIYFFMTRNNPIKFAYGVLQALVTALGTSSSAGTLPVTIRCLENNLGIDKRVTRFVLPIGATMNMDGTALLEGVASITIAQMHDIPLSFGQIITISLTATVASIGAAAIPSAGLVTLLLVLTAIGVPTEAVALLWTVDWFLDRFRTAINVFGDCVGAGIVHHKNRVHLTYVDGQAVLPIHDQRNDEACSSQAPDDIESPQRLQI